MTGPQLLTHWLSTQDVHAPSMSLALTLRVPAETVSRWANGKRLPQYPERLALEYVTDGEVPALSWEWK